MKRKIANNNDDSPLDWRKEALDLQLTNQIIGGGYKLDKTEYNQISQNTTYVAVDRGYQDSEMPKSDLLMRLRTQKESEGQSRTSRNGLKGTNTETLQPINRNFIGNRNSSIDDHSKNQGTLDLKDPRATQSKINGPKFGLN